MKEMHMTAKKTAESKKASPRTERMVIGKATVWASKNKAKLDGMPFDDIARMFRGQFHNEFISNAALKDICEAAGIRRLRGPHSKINKQDKFRTVARVMLEFMTEVEKHIGAPCLSEEGRHILEKMKAGSKHEPEQEGVEQSEGT